MSANTIIKLENVTKVFDGREVIHNCSMNVPKGSVYGFVGPNGAGKTTILKMASVLTPRERMGSIGAERLLARIRGESVTPKMLDLGFTLSPGGSI